MLLSGLSARVLSPSSLLPTTTTTTTTTVLLLLLSHPGRELVAIVVIDWGVVGLSLLLLLMARRGEWGTGRGDSSLFGGIYMGMVFNLERGYCMM